MVANDTFYKELQFTIANINLNANESDKQEQSIERILKALEGLSKVGGRSLIFHLGFYLGDSKEERIIP